MHELGILLSGIMVPIAYERSLTMVPKWVSYSVGLHHVVDDIRLGDLLELELL